MSYISFYIIAPLLQVQKQPPQVFYKKGVLKNFAKLTGDISAGISFLIKLQASGSVLRNTFGQLLLQLVDYE